MRVYVLFVVCVMLLTVFMALTYTQFTLRTIRLSVLRAKQPAIVNEMEISVLHMAAPIQNLRSYMSWVLS